MNISTDNTAATPRPFDKPLLWREERDDANNSTYEALSITHGKGEPPEPFLYWHILCVLKNNAAVWSIEDSDPVLRNEFLDVSTDFSTVEEAMAACQSMENDIRASLGEGLPPVPEPEPEAAPIIGDEHGFNPTTTIRVAWSPNDGRLSASRVWRQPGPPFLEQERPMPPDEEEAAFAGYFTQKMIEELVTRLAAGSFGRFKLVTPFAVVEMQVELDFLSITSLSATISRGGKDVELPMTVPTMDRIMAVVARQMHKRQQDLIKKTGNRTEADLRSEIARNARILGLGEIPMPGGILPVTIEDIQAGGGDITKKGGGL